MLDGFVGLGILTRVRRDYMYSAWVALPHFGV